MDNDKQNIVTTDYIIFGITVAISVGIGLIHAFTGGKQKTTEEYIVGNRKLSIIPVGLSMLVTFQSSIMMIGVPAEIYVYGNMYWLFTCGYTVSIILGTLIVVPLVHPLKIKSVYEYLEFRYKCRTVRLLGTINGMLYYIVYMGIVLFGPGIALEATTNLPFLVSVVIVASAAVIYTSIGGIKAVVWTDVFQCLIMFMGMFAIVIKGTMLVGGPKNVFQINADHGRMHMFDFDPNPTVRHTFWCLTFGSSISLIHLAFNQSTVQRVSAVATQSKARKVLYISAVTGFLIWSLATLEGVVAYAYYSYIQCDPLTSKQIKNPNQIIPFMVLDTFRNIPGMAGLFMASLFSASLSTLSSGLASLSAITVEDIVKPNFNTLSDGKLTLIAKLSVPLYGLLSLGISFMIAEIPGSMTEIATSLMSAISGPYLGLFLYSVFFPWATVKGAMVGTLSSAVLTYWLSLGRTLSKTLPKTPWATMPPINQCPLVSNSTYLNSSVPLEYSLNVTTGTLTYVAPEGLDKYYALSYQWTGLLGMLYCFVVAVATSLIEGLPKSEDVDVRFVLSFCDTFFPFIPQRLRQKSYLGVQFDQRYEWLQRTNMTNKNTKNELLQETRTTATTANIGEDTCSGNFKTDHGHEQINLLQQIHPS